MRKDFAVFICTHGRPNSQHTLDKLLKSGYTGRYYLILDDQDDTIQQYIDNFGTEHLIVFDKNHYINSIDTGSTTPPYKCIVYAKNAVEDIAKDMKLSVFAIADDDICNIKYRWQEGDMLKSKEVHNNIDRIFELYIEAMLSMNIVASSFGGFVHYYFGVESFNNEYVQNMKIPFQFVFRNAITKVDWISGFGEDVITAVVANSRGQLWQVLPQIEILTKPFETAGGGMLSTYRSMSSFERTMYNFIFSPSVISISCRNGKYKPSVKYNNCMPKILSTLYRTRKD